jgi:hypothetical protein
MNNPILERKLNQFNQPFSDLEEKIKLVLDSKEFSTEIRVRVLLDFKRDLLSFLSTHEDHFTQLIAIASEDALNKAIDFHEEMQEYP